MNRILFSFILCITFCFAKGQTNLLLNPSFEDTAQNWSTVNYTVCKDWINANGATADWYSPYAPLLGWSMFGNVPPYIDGYQYAHSGQAFCGIDLFEPKKDLKEYVEGKLSAPLLQDSIYTVSIYIVRSENYKYNFNEVSIGFYQSLQLTTSQGKMAVTDSVSFNLKGFTDTLNWAKFEAKYKAKGGEQFIIIGSFISNDSITYVDSVNYPAAQNNLASYIYIDDVDVRLSRPNNDIFISNVITPNNDNLNDNWVVNLKDNKNSECSIYNRWGIKVFETNTQIISWNGHTASGQELCAGVYYYALKFIDTKNNSQTKTGFIHLLK